MALQQSYTDKMTNYVYENIVYVPVTEFGHFYDKTLTIEFYGFSDVESARAALYYQNVIQPKPVIVKRYIVESTEFYQLVSSDFPGNSLLERVSAACYAAALSTLDTEDPDNPDGPKISYFKDATEVPITP